MNAEDDASHKKEGKIIIDKEKKKKRMRDKDKKKRKMTIDREKGRMGLDIEQGNNRQRRWWKKMIKKWNINGQSRNRKDYLREERRR